YEFQTWNRITQPSTPKDFQQWHVNGSQLFPLDDGSRSVDLIDKYQLEFKTPSGQFVSANEIRKAGGLLRVAPSIVHQMVEPDWNYHFELDIPMDNGERGIFQAYRIHHDNTEGPNKGGIRLDKDVDYDGVGDLAREMTIKISGVGRHLGGGKAGIRV